MVNIFLRPDLKTHGGEVSDILYNGLYVGSITLVYREHERVSGAVQLDKPSLSSAKKAAVLSYVHHYIESFAAAIHATECSVPVSYSAFDPIIEPFAMNDLYEADEMNEMEEMEELDEMNELDRDEGIYELVIVREGRRHVEYQIYDEMDACVAEAFMRIRESDVYGEIHWFADPSAMELDAITGLVISDFDENQIDTFIIHHLIDNEIIETNELTHEALLQDELDEGHTEYLDNEDYTVVLARDDEDTLTYEIYEQSSGGLPVGTATVNIGHRLLTGFIDFHKQESAEDTDEIAALLMRELDKEKEYEGINLTLLYKNQPIDELRIECVQVH